MNRFAATVLMALFVPTLSVRADDVELDKVTYNLKLPKKYDSSKTYHLYVAVHGLNWNGQMADGEMKTLQKRGFDKTARQCQPPFPGARIVA